MTEQKQTMANNSNNITSQSTSTNNNNNNNKLNFQIISWNANSLMPQNSKDT